jgi:golgi apyrase
MGKWRYGVVLDAGSSGTRVHIYRWLDNVKARQAANTAELNHLPSLETHGKWTKKIHPGVSSFGETPNLVGPDHLESLLTHALNIVPKHSVQDTPIFLLATAGVRLLPDHQREELLRQICSYTKVHSRFLLPDCDNHIQVIAGETEALYGWTAANYLLGGFDAPEEHAHGKGHHTYGFLEMGGASAQLAFAPNSTVAEQHSNDLTLLRLRNVGGHESDFRVFVTTWLGFGVHETRRKYVSALLESSGEKGVDGIPDPCLPDGIKTSTQGILLTNTTTSEPYLRGTGTFDKCLRATYTLLDKDTICADQPCLLHGVHVPPIDFDVNHFIGTSEYWHTTHEIFESGHRDKAHDFNTYQNRVKEFCQRDWASIAADVASHEFGEKVDDQTAHEICFKASWLINVLHNGIGIPRLDAVEAGDSTHNGTKQFLEGSEEGGFLEPFQAVNKIKNTEVSWTLGKMVLYASSQIPPADEDGLPVGFGSNEPGVPQDFQYPGGKPSPFTSNSSTSQLGDASLSEHIHETLFYSDNNHRLPGFLFIILVVFIAGFCFCGSDKRCKIYRKIIGSPGRKRHFFASKLPFFSRGNAPLYERVLEDGGELENPAMFELDEVDSDDSEPGQTSIPGRAAPRKKIRGEMMSQDIMDRSGLVVRSESREQLALHNGRKSRTGSPARVKGWPTNDD